MSTDRELLELAAKAAGLQSQKNTECVDADDKFIGIKVRRNWNDRYARWNPLADDGAALRLLTKLRMHFDCVEGWSVCYSGSVCAEQFSERHGNDADAATRRAIVRAAAEIGKAMP